MEQQEYETIDLREIVQIIRKNLIIIVAVTLVAALCGYFVTAMFITPKYKASATMIVNAREDMAAQTVVTNDQLTSASKLVETYSVILKSDTVLDKTIQDLGLNLTYDQLVSKVSVTPVNSTQVMEIAVVDPSADLAKKIAQSIFSKEEETEFVDAKGLIIQPSFVDLHAHFRCPGQEQKEEIATAVKAAAAGGFGTLVLMPNTTPPVSSMEEAAAVCEQAQQYSMAQVIQSVSITHHFDGKTLSHLDTLPEYPDSSISPEARQFSTDSLHTLPGIPLVTEDGRDVESAAVLFRAMELCGKKGIAVACHCEDMSLAAEARQFRSRARAILYEGAKGDPKSFLKNLSEEKKREAFALLEEANRILRMAEDVATKRNIDVAHEADCHLHVCHISTEGSLEALRQAKEKGYKVTCEATPHHIGFGLTTSDENLVHIVNPPLRLAKDQAALFDALIIKIKLFRRKGFLKLFVESLLKPVHAKLFLHISRAGPASVFIISDNAFEKVRDLWGTGSAAVPLLLAPLVVVGPPSLDDGTAAVESLLLRVGALVGPVAVEALPPKFGLFLCFHRAGIMDSRLKPFWPASIRPNIHYILSTS